MFVVTAPSGAGKSSLIAAAREAMPELRFSVSHTTRTPRPGETEGREYHFVDRERFQAMVNDGAFVESAEVHGNLYGTSHRAIEAALAKGETLILEIDWQGAEQVRRLYPQAISVFVLPPSVSELERRLRARGHDSDDDIARRMAVAREEMTHAVEFDYVIINRSFDDARQDFLAIVRSERLRTVRQLGQNPHIFDPKG